MSSNKLAAAFAHAQNLTDADVMTAPAETLDLVVVNMWVVFSSLLGTSSSGSRAGSCLAGNDEAPALQTAEAGRRVT